MALQQIKAKQVPSMGESPAEARKRMEAAPGGAASAPEGRGEEVPEFTAEHLAAIREVEEGFSAPSAEGATVEEAEELTEPPTPSKAMETIRQLSQDKNQAIAERDAALGLVERYRSKYGELD